MYRDPMRIEGYDFQVERRDDGRSYLTAAALPGFRLIVHPNEDIETEVANALKIFLPLFEAAKAKP